MVDRPNGDAEPLGSSAPVGFQPAQIRHAYGFDQVSVSGGIVGDGSGQTIAIVDAYDTPNILSELQAFDAQFGIPDPPSFKRVAQDGSTNYPPVDPRGAGVNNWELETALDVEWSHALAPGANILLVEAANNGPALDGIAVPFAASQPGVSVVSMSFGSSETPTEIGLDADFTTPAGHTGVTFVASTGDGGAPGEYPAYSPNVLAVGGTTLSLNNQNQISSETGWSGSGGGISTIESQPGYQAGVVTQSTTQRTIPDVSLIANPSTGVTIYDSYNGGTATPWEQIGGTSVSAPSWAAVIAIANQGRSAAGLPNLDGRSGTLPAIYNLPGSDFHDITSGSNGTNSSAGPGYDLVTGRGSPNVPLIVGGLAGTSIISGSVFSDTNDNGTLDSSEGGLTGWTVFDDLNNNGILDPPAQSTVNSLNAPLTIPARSTITSTTTVTGFVGGVIDLNVNLSIAVVRASNLILTLTGPDGTSVTLANRNGGTAANFTNTTFDDQAATAVASGTAPYTGSFRPTGLLSAFNGKAVNGVWTLTVNGVNSTTAGTLNNWSLQVLSPTEPSVTTGAGGIYDLPVSAGAHHIREISQGGFAATGPTGGVYNVTIATGQNSLGNNFGNLPSSISGQVFDDPNDNGVLDPGENTTQGVVFDDLNNNGLYDSTSQWNVTSLDVPKPVSTLSTVLSNTVVDDLAGSISDLNINLSINDTQDSNLSVSLIGPNGTTVNLINHNGGSGVNFVNTTFDDQATTAIGSGAAPFTGSFKPASVLSAFIGKSPNGTWTLAVTDTGSPNTGTVVSWSLQFTTNAGEPAVISTDGNYQFTNLLAGTHHIRELILGDTLETSPPGGAYVVAVSTQSTTTNANFGNHAASVGGTVFLDANNDGTFDSGDSGLGGWLVYDDQNDDGIFTQAVQSNTAALDDPQPITSQNTTTSDITISGQTSPISNVIVNLSLHYPNDGDLSITLTDPAGNLISLDNQVATGANMIDTTFADGATALTNGVAPYTGSFQSSDLMATLNGDNANGVWQLQVTDEGQVSSGTLDGWNLVLTTGTTEPNTTTNPDGSFQFNDQTEGVHHYREIPPAGYVETSPASGVYDETLATGAYVTGVNFGNIAVISATPGAPALLPASDTGILNTDGITRLNNANASNELSFLVSGTVAGATVTLDADGQQIGSAVASGNTTTITTNGSLSLADGSHLITAFQTEPDKLASTASSALPITIDTTPPIATVVAVTPNPLTTSPNSLTITFNEPVSGLDLSDLAFTLNGGQNLLTSAQTISSTDGITWTLSNLSALATVSGTYQLTLNPVGTPVVDLAGNQDTATASTTFALNLGPGPEVTDVLVDGTAWTGNFLGALQSAGEGNGSGYAIPVGSAAQSAPLPWINLNQVQITFNEDVNVQQASLALTGLNVANYAFNGFSYNNSTHTATWTLASPIGADRLQLNLASTGAAAVKDNAGNSLDGEWTSAASSYPSGNGTPGGDFHFGFNVLPADLNQDGVVNGLDINQIASHWLATGGLLGDVNGDAVVNGLDINAIASQWLTSLPAGGGSGTGAASLAVSSQLSPSMPSFASPQPIDRLANYVGNLSLPNNAGQVDSLISQNADNDGLVLSRLAQATVALPASNIASDLTGSRDSIIGLATEIETSASFIHDELLNTLVASRRSRV
ncbi:MAG TPA: proprotein convertase P-domain-containing protein [Pirellulales bacterium]|jgi:subtilase family serine protease